MNGKIIKCVEKINLQKLLYIIRNINKLNGVKLDKAGITFLKKLYLKHLNGNHTVNYCQVDKNKTGRFFSMGPSLQNIKSIIRNTISKEFNNDYDIRNSCPNILLNICTTSKIWCDKLKEYCTNREKTIKELMDINKNLNRDFIKTNVIISMINNGFEGYEKVKNKTEWLIDFHEEIKKIHENLVKNNTKMKKAIKIAKKENKDNIIGSAISSIVCSIENTILQEIINIFKNLFKMKDNYTMCFDGILVPIDIKPNLKLCNKNLKDKFGFAIELIKKELNSVLDLKDYKENKKDTSLFKIGKYDINDHEFFYNDFIKKYHNKIFENEMDLVEKTSYDLGRVSIFVDTGCDPMIVVKGSKMNLFNVVKCKDVDSFVIFKIIGKKPRSIKFQEYLSIMLSYFTLYRGITNDPSDLDKNNFNIYMPILTKPNNKNYEKIKLLLEFIKNIICSGNESHYRYILSWLKILVCHPSEKTRICLFLYGTKGIGKSTLFDFLCEYVIGDHKSWEISGLDKLFKQFNSALDNSRLVCISEASNKKGNFFYNHDMFKSYITDKSLDIEKKFKNTKKIKNLCNFGITSNNEFSLKLNSDNRRFFCLEVSEAKKMDVEYFGKLRKECFNSECANIFHTFLENYTDAITNLENMPKTELFKNIVKGSENNYCSFIREYFSKEENNKLIRICDFYSEYIQFCDENGENFKFSKMKISRYLTKMKVKRVTTQNTKFYNFEGFKL